MDTYIYGLTHPITSEIKYIGKSDKPKLRLWQHITDVKHPSHLTKKEAWVRSLLRNGLKPKLIILETVTEGNWQDREKYWITKYKGQLKNGTDGGDGTEGYKHTKEALEKMKPTWIKKGQRISKATEFKKGRKLTKEQINMLVKINTGRMHSKESLRKMSIVQKKSAKDRGLSEKMKGNQRALGSKWTLERKAAFIQLRTGYKMSQETKDRIKAGVSKPVIQYSLKGEFIKEWESAKYAAKVLCLNYKSINNNLNNHSRASEGFVWKYKNIPLSTNL